MISRSDVWLLLLSFSHLLFLTVLADESFGLFCLFPLAGRLTEAAKLLKHSCITLFKSFGRVVELL